MKINPLNGRIVVKPDDQKNETASGILVATEQKERAKTGVVLEGTALVPVDSHVVFSMYGYDEVELEDETIYLMPETNVLAILP